MPGANTRNNPASAPSGRTVYRGPAGSGTRAQGQRNAPGFASGLGALADMLSGAGIGATAATLGVGGDLEQLARGLYGAATAHPEQDALAAGLLAADRSTALPTTQDMRGYLPPPTQFSIPADQNAHAQLGEYLPLPISPSGAARGAATAARDVAGGARSALGGLGRIGAAGVEMGAQGRGPLSFMQAALEPRYAVRPRGGNFSDVRLEDYLGEALNVHTPGFLERSWVVEGAQPRQGAAATWAQKQLANYLKRDLGAPTDPLLQVEQELPNLHFGADGLAGMPLKAEDTLDMQTWRDLQDVPYRKTVYDREKGGKFGRRYVEALNSLEDHDALTGGPGATPLTPWGAYSGAQLHPTTPTGYVSDLTHGLTDGETLPEDVFRVAKEEGFDVPAWLEKAPPDTKIWSLVAPTEDSLGFNHVLDYFEAAQNAARNVAYRGGADALRADLAGYGPRDMQEFRRALELHDAGLSLTPEQIGKTSVADAVRKTAAWNDLLAQGMGGPTNPDLMRGWQALKEYPDEGMQWVEFGSAADDEAQTALRAGLNAEGAAMGHCVGGYCDDVQRRGTKIYSLRDKNGNPHVTIETRPDKGLQKTFELGDPDEFNALAEPAMAELQRRDPALYDKWDEMMQEGYGIQEQLRWLQQAAPDIYRSLAPTPTPTESIIQIKGKKNAAPVEEDLPFVQDFVKSRQWGRVGDLSNTGLIPVDPTSDMAKWYAAQGQPAPQYLSQDELTATLARMRGEPGYAHGGSVQPSMFMQRAQAMLKGPGYAGGGAVRQLKKLWHAGTIQDGAELNRPLFLSDDKELAASYMDMAADRGMAGAALHPYSFELRNSAPAPAVDSFARRAGIDPAEGTPASMFDQEIHGPAAVNSLVQALRRAGYDHTVLDDIAYGAERSGQAHVVFPEPGRAARRTPAAP